MIDCATRITVNENNRCPTQSICLECLIVLALDLFRLSLPFILYYYFSIINNLLITNFGCIIQILKNEKVHLGLQMIRCNLAKLQNVILRSCTL